MRWSEEQLAAHYARLKSRPEPVVLSKDTRSESAIEAECTKLLEEDGWRALRTDPVSDKSRGKGFGEVGMADHLYMRPMTGFVMTSREGAHWVAEASTYNVLWVEFKAKRGRLSAKQELWHLNERARGFVTWIAGRDFPASVEGFRDHYENSGLMRRQRWW